ncbi:DNA ligase [Paenibacillus sp. ACRRX]|uniref:DNA ligase n=1 Tax=Paenibacillus sp. ACRRX TaxID=2918206 RepID=UPI001EF3DE28|nr:DNA ligase [Paenibacillus sp. ACRRX]MCG7407514.1 DNA ligase [Paenibacillus sp. ACRRX]
MNITNMVRGMMGDAKPGETRALELKTGQQVRGVVMSTSENGREAVVQINGVSVRAVLDTPMQPGQATWLQVQGQQEDGMVILKPSEGPNSKPLPSIAEALKQSGLPNEPWARQLLSELQKSGMPLTKELVDKLAQAMVMKPSGVSTEQWMQAAAVAMKRQLPLTADSLRGLQQAMFGKPLHDLLAAFSRAGDMPAPIGAGQAAWAAPLKEAQALMRALVAAMPQAEGQSPHSGSQSGTPVSMLRASAEGALQQGSGAGNKGNSTGASQAGTSAQASQTGSTGTTAGSGTGSGINGTATGVGSTQGTAGSAANIGATAGNAAGASTVGTSANGIGSGQPQGSAGIHSSTAAQSNNGVSTPASAQSGSVVSSTTGAITGQQAGTNQVAGAGHAAPEGAGNVIGRMLSLLGVSHEREVQRAILPQLSLSASSNASAQAPASAQTSAPNAQAALASAMPDAAQDASRATQAALTRTGIDAALPAAMPQQHAAGTAAAASESLKSTLLQLLQSEGLPPHMREAAQQIVQHITGQQLLLTSDRSLPFSHVTLFVPLVTPDGTQTAAVHIQSRQGGKGELDASNCRLWFDLNLKSMGRTLVDVNVVDKLVALNVHHNDEQVQEMLQPLRPEIDAAISKIGYQLSAFRTLPLPDRESELQTPERTFEDYAPKNYKGVDLRI